MAAEVNTVRKPLVAERGGGETASFKGGAVKGNVHVVKGLQHFLNEKDAASMDQGTSGGVD